MARRLCMFCGNAIEPDQLTMEHFVPKGLWEKGHRPANMKTLPAHMECNNSYSEDNEYFRDVMAMEEGAQKHSEAERIQSGAIQRKFVRRFGSIIKTLRNLRLRRVHTPAGVYIGQHPAFEIDRSSIDRVLVNVMKGIFYVAQGQPLPQEFITFVADVRAIKMVDVEKAASFMVPWQSFGDTVFCCRYAVSNRQPIEKMTCLMRFYDHRMFLGEAISPELLGHDGHLWVPAKKESEVLVPRWAADR